MEKSEYLLEKIKELQSLGIGDAVRLEHIVHCIAENKRIYNSDFQYVNDLSAKINNTKEHMDSREFCWKCGKRLMQEARYCSFCGILQNNQESDIDTMQAKRKRLEINPVKIISNCQSYQILAVIGGAISLTAVLYAILNLDRIFEIIEFYSGRDLSGYGGELVMLGAISSCLSVLVMVLPFLIKKPKRVGKILFFSSFGILASSLLTGVIGFVIILVSGIFALKQRRY